MSAACWADSQGSTVTSLCVLPICSRNSSSASWACGDQFKAMNTAVPSGERNAWLTTDASVGLPSASLPCELSIPPCDTVQRPAPDQTLTPSPYQRSRLPGVHLV